MINIRTYLFIEITNQNVVIFKYHVIFVNNKREIKKNTYYYR